MDEGLMLYDADCGFCTRTAAQVHRLGVRVARASIQESDLARLGVDAQRALQEMPFVHPDGRVEYGHRAWAAILETGPWPVRAIARAQRSRAVDPLAARVYRWISEHRNQLPGGTAQCLPENRPGEDGPQATTR